MTVGQKIGYGLLKLVSRLPFWLLYSVGDFLYLLMYYVIGYRKKVVMDNLRRSFPAKSEQELIRLAKDFYHNFADVQIETLKSITISKEEVQRRVTYTNVDLIDSYYLKGITTISATSHKCNWEWMLLGASVHFKTPVHSLYKELSSPFFEQVMKDIRTRFGAYMIPDQRILRELAANKNKVRTIAMVADQTPAKEAPHKLWFLNQPTLFFAGMEKIAVTLQCPILFADINRVKRGYYTVTYYPLSEPPYNKDNPGIVERYAALCEEAILRQPANWLWSHKRWKHKVEW